jgi:hypothetical protein
MTSSCSMARARASRANCLSFLLRRRWLTPFPRRPRRTSRPRRTLRRATHGLGTRSQAATTPVVARPCRHHLARSASAPRSLDPEQPAHALVPHHHVRSPARLCLRVVQAQLKVLHRPRKWATWPTRGWSQSAAAALARERPLVAAGAAAAWSCSTAAHSASILSSSRRTSLSRFLDFDLPLDASCSAFTAR